MGWEGVNIAGHDGCLVAEVGKLLRLYLGVCVCVCECVYIRQQPFQCFFSFCLPSLPLPNQPPPPPDNLPRVSARGEREEERVQRSVRRVEAKLVP